MQTIELDAKLLEQAEANARSGGFSSVKVYIEHILVKEFAKSKEEQVQDEEITRKMEETGYLDEGLDI